MIILLQHDLEAAVTFYKALGLPLKFHLKNSWAEFEVGPVKLGLCPVSKASPERITGIVLDVDDVKKMYHELKDTINFRSEPIEKVHGIMVSIQDPGGNVIDLYQPTPEKVQKLVKDVVSKDLQQEAKKPESEASCGCQDNNACA